MKSRADILKFLQDSFAYSHEAARNLTLENALGLVEFRGSKVTRLSLAVLALTHINDVEYAPMCGVVPPGGRPMKMP